MGGRLTPEEIQRFRDVSIHTVLGIENTGRKISMCCPMPQHHDRNPSFLLAPDNSYHCFGCGVHGSNAIDFIRDYSGKTRLLDIAVELLPYVRLA